MNTMTARSVLTVSVNAPCRGKDKIDITTEKRIKKMADQKAVKI